MHPQNSPPTTTRKPRGRPKKQAAPAAAIRGPPRNPEPAPQPRYRSPVDWCAHYGPSASTLYVLIKEKKILAKKLGKKTLVCTESSEAYFAALPEVHAEGAA